MSKFKAGDHVRWVGDVDKVYSTDTKTFVGKTGKILPSRDEHQPPKGFYDIAFPNGDRLFQVWGISERDLVKADAP